MNISITTIEGTFLVPTERQADLIQWLKSNAIKVGQQTVYEYTDQDQTRTSYNGRTLINE